MGTAKEHTYHPSALRFYLSPATISARVRPPLSRSPPNLLKTNILLFSKSFSKHHTLTAEERVSCLALFSIIVVFTATIAHQCVAAELSLLAGNGVAGNIDARVWRLAWLFWNNNRTRSDDVVLRPR